MRHAALTWAVPLSLLLGTIEANAHATLDHAEPRAGSIVATAPSEITLYFTDKLEPAFSRVTVTNDAGERVDSGKASVSGSQMSIPLMPGGAGKYHVKWHALSVDTHASDGNFTFQVGQ